MFGELERFAARTALVLQDGREICYAALLEAAEEFCAEVRAGLPATVRRPLVLIETRQAPEAIAAYVGALRAGWPVILTAEAGPDDRIRRDFRPNWEFRPLPDAQGWQSHAADPEPAPMHPDLRVLLSTSGTTGAPKLVRLSAGNLAANAQAIIGYLDIRPDDRAITALPFHYSYGMSVLNSHLAAGATLLLTAESVAAASFWDFFDRAGGSSLALVPFQFDLLEKSGALERPRPRLRYVTQAGGRLPETSVLRFAALARRDGWRLFLMYGQTEAAPRMAYMPPDLVETHPDGIGIPIPGGRFSLIDADGAEIKGPGRPGELIYEGPNVMLGYAETRAALADPAGPPRLATGDMAERLEDGTYRIVGRLKRFIKLFGLRISLDDAEGFLRGAGMDVYCTGRDDRLCLFAIGPENTALARRARDALADRYGLPLHAIAALPLAEVPLLPSGKPDYGRLRDLAAAAEADRPGEAAGSPPARGRDLWATLCRALRNEAPDLQRSFAELGGDSLSYLEVQLALEERLGRIPAAWETMALADLLALQPGPRERSHLVQTGLLLRVAALAAVIALHSTALPLSGGAYLLMAMVGYSLARFQARPLFAGATVGLLRSMLQPILIGYYTILIPTHLLRGPVDLSWFLLLGNFQTDFGNGLQPYWFVCLYAQLMFALALAFSIPTLRRTVARAPLAWGMALVAGLLALCLGLGIGQRIEILEQRHPLFALQLVGLGWAAFFAGRRATRLAVSGLLILEVTLIWNDSASIIGFVLGGGLLLLWTEGLRLPTWLARGLSVIGSATLFIYLLHVPVIMVASHLPGGDPVHLAAALCGSVLAGLAAQRLYEALAARAGPSLHAAFRRKSLA